MIDINAVSIANIQPGDIIILRTDHDVPPEQVKFIKELAFPDNQVIVLAPGIDLEIARPTAE